MTPSLEGLQTKAKEVPSPHEVRLVLLNTNSVFQCLREIGNRCLQSTTSFPKTSFFYKSKMWKWMNNLHCNQFCKNIWWKRLSTFVLSFNPNHCFSSPVLRAWDPSISKVRYPRKQLTTPFCDSLSD